MVLFQKVSNSQENMGPQPLRRVLIVDDEPSVREMLAVALEMAGFEVTEADNASSKHHEGSTEAYRQSNCIITTRLNADRLDDATSFWP